MSMNMPTAVARRYCVLVLLFAVAACGGGGGGGSSAPATPPSKVFVTDEGNSAIGSLINPNPSPGTFGVDRIVVGSNTTFLPAPCTGCIRSIALDAAGDRLYVAVNSHVLVFNQISTANGNVSPARSISSGLVFSEYLALDTTNDVLYVGDGIHGVGAYAGASGLNGPATAARTLAENIPDLANQFMYGIAVDVGRDMLYVANLDSSKVTNTINVFTASTANSSTTPDRTISLPYSSTIRIFLDAANDRLYVAGPAGGISVYDSAHSLSGPVASATRTITLPFAAQFALFVDATNDRLYAVAANRGFIVNGASTATDPVTATSVTVLTTANAIQMSAVAVAP